MNEQKKYETIKYLADHPDANKDRAALTLNCTRRHINRMLAGYKKQGKEFFVHGNRGRKPATTIPAQSRQIIVALYRNKYFNANFQHFTELLAKHEQIHISASSVAAILESEYILSPKVTRSKQKRLKKSITGSQTCCSYTKGSRYNPGQSGCCRRCPLQTPQMCFLWRTDPDGCLPS